MQRWIISCRLGPRPKAGTRTTFCSENVVFSRNLWGCDVLKGMSLERASMNEDCLRETDQFNDWRWEGGVISDDVHWWQWVHYIARLLAVDMIYFRAWWISLKTMDFRVRWSLISSLNRSSMFVTCQCNFLRCAASFSTVIALVNDVDIEGAVRRRGVQIVLIAAEPVVSILNMSIAL